MKAVAVLPGRANSVHLRDIPAPTLDTQPHPHVGRIPDGRGVLVQSLRIGVDATDREINEALYGNAPPGATTWSSATRALAGCWRSGTR